MFVFLGCSLTFCCHYRKALLKTFFLHYRWWQSWSQTGCEGAGPTPPYIPGRTQHGGGSSGMAALCPGGSHWLDACGQSAHASGACWEEQTAGRADRSQRQRPAVPDLEKHPGPLPGHIAGELRKRVLLQWGDQRVLFWPRPRCVPQCSQLLSHGQTPLPTVRVHFRLRWGASLLWHRPGDHRRLLLWRVQG